MATANSKDFIVKNGIQVEGTGSSISTSTGALIVGGGLGLAENAWIGGQIVRYGNVNVTSSQGVAFALTSATYTDATLTGAVGLSTVNYIGAPKIDSTNTGVVVANAATFYIDSAPTTASNKISFTNAWAAYLKNGNVYIGSSSTNTGSFAGNALQVTGGISSNGGLYVSGGGNLYGRFNLNGSAVVTLNDLAQGSQIYNGDLVVTTTTNSTSVGSGGLLLTRGGAGIAGNLYVGGIVNVTSSTNATSTGTGALIVNGGIGIGRDLYASNGFFVSGSANINEIIGNSLQVTNNGGLAVSGTSRLQGNVLVASATAGTSLTSAALVVTGGAGIGGKLYVDSINVTDSTQAATVSAASVVLSGGLAVQKNLIIGSTNSSNTTASNALYVVGGVGIDKDLIVGRNAVIQGSLTLLQPGTQLVVNSTQTYVADPVIDIGGGPNGDPLSIVDVYDKGIMIHYNNGTTSADNNHAFFGYEHTQGRFILKKNVYPGSSNQFPVTNLLNTGSYATFDLGSLNALDTTDSLTTGSGAVVVAGGVGIGKQLRVHGTVTANNDFTVGGTFRSTSTVDSTDVNSGAVIISGGLGVKNTLYATTASFTKTRITGGADATSPSTGDLIVTGGIGVNKVWTRTLQVESSLYANSATSNNALLVTGGIGVGQGITAAGTVAATEFKVVSNLISSASYTTSTSAVAAIDAFVANSFTTVKYFVQVIDVTGSPPNKFHISEIVLVYDGSGVNGVYISQYGIVTNTGELGTFEAEYFGGNIRLLFTPYNTPSGTMRIQALRTSMTSGV